MVRVVNRELIFPVGEEKIGTTYDENAEYRTFSLPRVSASMIDLASLDFYLDLQYANDGKDTMSLEKVVEDERILLIWEIASGNLQVPGTVLVSIRGYEPAGEVKFMSYKAPVYVEDAINTPGSYTGKLTEFEQAEQKIKYCEDAAGKALVAADAATSKAREADISAKNAIAQAQRAEIAATDTERAISTAYAAANEATIAGERVENAITLATEAANNANEKASNAESAALTADASRRDTDELRQEILEKLNNGEFKGEKGDSGIQVSTSGLFSLYLDTVTGNLYVDYQEGSEPPKFQFDAETGNLYYLTGEDANG